MNQNRNINSKILLSILLAILLGLSLLNYGFRCLRWHIYTRAMGIKLSLAGNTRHYLGGFALTATPGRIGELIRLRWIWRETGRKPDSTGSLVLIDRAADLTAVGLILTIAIAVSTVGIQGGGMIGWTAEAVAFYILLIWLGGDITLPTALAIFFFSMLSGSATGLPGGIGGAEAAMIALLTLFDVPLQIALPATAIIRITTLWFAILVGIIMFPFAERMSINRMKEA